MKNKEKKPIAWQSKATILLFAYPLGMIMGICLWLGELLGKIVILNRHRLKPEDLGKIILVSNHPSWGDPFFVSYLLFDFYARNPLKHAPLIVADRKQFFDHWFVKLFQSVMIPVDRGDAKKEALSFRRILEFFSQNERPGILFAEGKRTFRGTEDELMYSQHGEKIIRLKEGIGLLVKQLKDRIIIPVAIKGSDSVCPNEKHRLFTKLVLGHKITINIGEPIIFESNMTRGEIAFKVGSKILALLDEIQQCRT